MKKTQTTRIFVLGLALAAGACLLGVPAFGQVGGNSPAPSVPGEPPKPAPVAEPETEALIALPGEAPVVAPAEKEEKGAKSLTEEVISEQAEQPAKEETPNLAPLPAEDEETMEPAPIPGDRGPRDGGPRDGGPRDSGPGDGGFAGDWENGLPPGASASLMDINSAVPVGPRGAFATGTSGRYWLRTDYLLWWTNGSYLPPILTTSDQDDNGVLGQPTTRVLFGDQRVNDRARHNVRFSGGWWLDDRRRHALEFDVYSLGRISTNYENSSTGEPLLARPFYDVLLDRQSSEYVAMRQPDPLFPSNIFNIQGTFRGHSDEDFRSLGVWGRYNLYTGGGWCLPTKARTYEECCAEVCCEQPKRKLFDCFRVDLIGGYRQYGLDDNFNADQDILVVNDPRGEVASGTTVRAQDHFHCRNDFNGGELGVIAEFFQQRWSVEVGAKLAIGSNSRLVTIRGNTLVTAPNGSTATHHYGWLAAPTNVGRYVSDDFAAIPEFKVDLGYQLNHRWRVHFGYTFLYWANIVRSSEQIDLNINTSYFAGQGPATGAARPSFDWKQGTFWAQGLNLGLEARW